MSDPRVSISRESAKGSISTKKPQSSNPSQSFAEAHLSKIRETAPPLHESRSLLKEDSRRSASSGNLLAPAIHLD